MMTCDVSVTSLADVVIAITSVISLVIALRNRGKILQIELATNSMKDALVKGAGREGVIEGLRQGAIIAAAAAEKTP